MINFKHLHYFQQVAELGGVTRASRVLHVSPQAISMQLAELEERLGVELFARVGRSLQLTDIDSKGPIGHRRLTNQKMLDLPGYGAVLAAVPDISKCNERDILQAIGFTQKGDRSLKEKAAIGREGSKQLEAARNREGLENFDGRDFR